MKWLLLLCCNCLIRDFDIKCGQCLSLCVRWYSRMDVGRIRISSICASSVGSKATSNAPNPDKPVLSIFWQIWVCFAVVYLVAGGAFLAGALLAYSWYLFVHHCTHHSAHRLPAFLIRNHNDHHKVSTRNYGVTTTLWDNVFGTALRRAASLD